MKLSNVNYSLFITALIILALVFAKSILVPFIIALIIWFLVKKTRDLIDEIGFINKYIPRWVKTVVASFLIFSLIVLVSKLLISNIETLAHSYEKYASNVAIVAKKINNLMGINLHDEFTHFINTFEFSEYLQSFINSLSEMLGNMLMIVFYAIFLFIEESLFLRKIDLMFTDEQKRANVYQTLSKIDKTLSRYAGLKSLIALITSTLSFTVLYIAGIDSPLFWTFLVFMFNFIPSVGPIIATILPALFSLIQFGDFTAFLIIIGGMGAISVLMGNFIEPRLMGNTLNISPLVTVLALAVWGAIWGIIGMLLSVPITVTMIIVFSQFKGTRNVAILLSEKGRV